ncbi:ER degradation-enhancing alpha-mannosidase-like protein 1 [Boothiomyces macroporosus]|uniref:alpha-1,2-Mannosidase n=1 Tax=Boothiomyces macroporosus TaxID=261099 RepID=A0AAD5ULA8_9FUNG|nr:ER degradation-enhancing alpha-mannosidase-like protein 1 [Boothiomyces macroporosus]
MYCCGFNPGDGSAYTGKTGFFNPDGTELVNVCAINSTHLLGCHEAGISYFQYFLYMTAGATIFAFVIGVSSIISAYLLYQKRTARQAFIHKGKGPYQPIMGKNEEFGDAVRKVISTIHFDLDNRVQVFEVTIRVLGGLLSAHLLASNPKLDCYLDWYNGELLHLAKDLADRLMPAFDTPFGLPYPRVNLKSGVLPYEVQEACTAGAGTLLLEFGTLSRLLGDEKYELAAKRLNLVGNTMNLYDDKWVDDMAGIGAGIDSFYEYLFKSYVLFGNDEYLKIYNEAYQGVMTHLVDGEGFIYKNVKMGSGKLAAPWLDSLSAFFPGLQVLAGDVQSAIRPHFLYASLWKRFNCIPERYNFQSQGLSISAYPLRPEFVESTYMLYQHNGNLLIDQLRGASMTVKYDSKKLGYVVTALNQINLQSGGKVYTSLRALSGTDYIPSNQYLSAIFKLKQKSKIISVYAVPSVIGPLLHHGLTITGKLVSITNTKSISSVNDIDSGCKPYTNAQQSVIAGSFVIVKRGDCNFVQKIENAYLAGAKGVLVLSQTPFISMTRPNQLYGDGMVNGVDTIPIPSFFLDDKETKRFLKCSLDKIYIKIVDKEVLHPHKKLYDQVSYFGSSIKNVVIGQGELLMKSEQFYSSDYHRPSELRCSQQTCSTRCCN